MTNKPFLLARSYLSGGRGKVLPYSRTKLRIRGHVEGAGHLHVGLQWPDNFARESFLVARAGSRIVTTGHFRILSGCTIGLGPGAVLRLGSGYINNGLDLSCLAEVSIGEDVAIGPHVRILDSDRHTITGSRGESALPIRIGDHVWIGMGVTLLKGVTIGDGAVIAAGSVVTRSVGAGELWGGTPARLIRRVEWR